MTTTFEQPGTTRSPDGLAPAAASPAWKSWAAAPRRGSRRYLHHGPVSRARCPPVPGRGWAKAGRRRPGDRRRHRHATTSPLPARVRARRVAGRVAHEPSVPARVLPGRTAGNARAGSPRARPAQNSRAGAPLPRTAHDACPPLGLLTPVLPYVLPARTRARARPREGEGTRTTPLAMVMEMGLLPPKRREPHLFLSRARVATGP